MTAALRGNTTWPLLASHQGATKTDRTCLWYHLYSSYWWHLCDSRV